MRNETTSGFFAVRLQATDFRLQVPGAVVQPMGALFVIQRHAGDWPCIRSDKSEIADAVILGLANRQIAARCGIAEQTVKDHLKHVYLKVGVHQRAALLARILSFLTDEQKTR